jgi:serine/threonine-protein kinase RsbW
MPPGWSGQCTKSVQPGKMDAMASLPASVPYPSAVEVCRWTLAAFSDLRVLRAALRNVLAEAAGLGPGDVADRMTFVATELATNALRHGAPPTVVRLMRVRDRLIIDVADYDRDAEPHVAEGRPLGAGGLGLQLARTFASDIGWYATDVTKHVWASFPS